MNYSSREVLNSHGVKNRKSIREDITNSIINNSGVACKGAPFVASHMPRTIRLIRRFVIAQEMAITQHRYIKGENQNGIRERRREDERERER